MRSRRSLIVEGSFPVCFIALVPLLTIMFQHLDASEFGLDRKRVPPSFNGYSGWVSSIIRISRTLCVCWSSLSFPFIEHRNGMGRRKGGQSCLVGSAFPGDHSGISCLAIQSSPFSVFVIVSL